MVWAKNNSESFQTSTKMVCFSMPSMRHIWCGHCHLKSVLNIAKSVFIFWCWIVFERVSKVMVIINLSRGLLNAKACSSTSNSPWVSPRRRSGYQVIGTWAEGGRCGSQGEREGWLVCRPDSSARSPPGRVHSGTRTRRSGRAGKCVLAVDLKLSESTRRALQHKTSKTI